MICNLRLAVVYGRQLRWRSVVAAVAAGIALCALTKASGLSSRADDVSGATRVSLIVGLSFLTDGFADRIEHQWISMSGRLVVRRVVRSVVLLIAGTAASIVIVTWSLNVVYRRAGMPWSTLVLEGVCISATVIGIGATLASLRGPDDLGLFTWVFTAITLGVVQVAASDWWVIFAPTPKSPTWVVSHAHLTMLAAASLLTGLVASTWQAWRRASLGPVM